MIWPPPSPTLFPYTTLFRSHSQGKFKHCERPALPSEPIRSTGGAGGDRKSTRLNSSHVSISYAVFCLKKKKTAARKTRQYGTTRRRRLLPHYIGTPAPQRAN